MIFLRSLRRAFLLLLFTDSACISKIYMLGRLSKNESLLCMSRYGNRSKSTVSIRFAQQSIEKMKGKTL